MPLVVAERRQTAARPANPAPQPWQTQLIQAPALAPSRPHTHTHEHTHTEVCANMYVYHTATNTWLILYFHLLCLALIPLFCLFAPTTSSPLSHTPPPLILLSLLLSSLTHSHLSFASHHISPSLLLSSTPSSSLLTSSLIFFSSSSPPRSNAFLLLLPWAPSRPGLGAWLLTEAPYLGPWVHTHINTHPLTHL